MFVLYLINSPALLSDLVSNEEYDVIGISESWIKLTNLNFKSEPSYTFLSNSRSNKRVGGVVLYTQLYTHPLY